MGFDFKTIGLAALSLVFSVQVGTAANACLLDRLDLRGDWGQAQFSIEIADDADERARGLMFRESMGRMAGMLFVYDAPQPVAFWMKNTILPLDMIFVGATGEITAIHENAIPGDTTPIPGGNDVVMVLELNAGTVDMLGISVGSQLRHQKVDQNSAIWACEEN